MTVTRVYSIACSKKPTYSFLHKQLSGGKCRLLALTASADTIAPCQAWIVHVQNSSGG